MDILGFENDILSHTNLSKGSLKPLGALEHLRWWYNNRDCKPLRYTIFDSLRILSFGNVA